MVITANDIREDKAKWKIAIGDGFESYPIRQWGTFTYIVVDKIDLTMGAQTLTVIDITDDPKVARFATIWPGHYYTPRYALVSPPEEGEFWLVMVDDQQTNTGCNKHYYATQQFRAADLTVFVGSASSVEIDNMIGDIAWAVDAARGLGWDQAEKQIADTIRAAARRGAIPGARQGDSGRWYFDKQAALVYLEHARGETRGRPSKIEELITTGDAHAIQHGLAEMVRSATGSPARGQLWQPCERPGCQNEPVCMNCMMCQSKHCHCFD